jgi:lipoyl(octanoyl) transferase
VRGRGAPAPAPWRLLVTEPQDGPSNMALDEALWRGRLAGDGPPTVRFFAWAPPTVSIGYGQRLDADLNLAACRRWGVGLVRRPTGGSAIYHDGPERELTYCVVAGSRDFAGAGELLEAYRWIAQALVEGLGRLGVPAEMVAVVPSASRPPAFCFARTGSYEIEVAGRKLVGSAQRRRREGFLQHGSVMLGVDAERLRALFPAEGDPLAGMTTIEAAIGRRPGFDEAAAALAEGFTRAHGIELRPGGLARSEQELADRLVRDKYGTAEWNERGRAAADLSRVS